LCLFLVKNWSKQWGVLYDAPRFCGWKTREDRRKIIRKEEEEKMMSSQKTLKYDKENMKLYWIPGLGWEVEGRPDWIKETEEYVVKDFIQSPTATSMNVAKVVKKFWDSRKSIPQLDRCHIIPWNYIGKTLCRLYSLLYFMLYYNYQEQLYSRSLVHLLNLQNNINTYVTIFDIKTEITNGVISSCEHQVNNGKYVWEQLKTAYNMSFQ
jgi:hypothetical protein